MHEGGLHSFFSDVRFCDEGWSVGLNRIFDICSMGWGSHCFLFDTRIVDSLGPYLSLHGALHGVFIYTWRLLAHDWKIPAAPIKACGLAWS